MSAHAALLGGFFLAALAGGIPVAAQQISKSEALKIYAEKTPFKAFAASRTGKAWGMNFGAHSYPVAQQKALELCERNRKSGDGRCRIVDIQGNYGNFKGRNYGLSAAARADYEQNYLSVRQLHKAFATSPDGPWSCAIAGSESAAGRKAVAQCSALGEGLAPCQVIDVDGYRRD